MWGLALQWKNVEDHIYPKTARIGHNIRGTLECKKDRNWFNKWILTKETKNKTPTAIAWRKYLLCENDPAQHWEILGSTVELCYQRICNWEACCFFLFLFYPVGPYIHQSPAASALICWVILARESNNYIAADTLRLGSFVMYIFDQESKWVIYPEPLLLNSTNITARKLYRMQYKLEPEMVGSFTCIVHFCSKAQNTHGWETGKWCHTVENVEPLPLGWYPIKPLRVTTWQINWHKWAHIYPLAKSCSVIILIKRCPRCGAKAAPEEAPEGLRAWKSCRWSWEEAD